MITTTTQVQSADSRLYNVEETHNTLSISRDRLVCFALGTGYIKGRVVGVNNLLGYVAVCSTPDKYNYYYLVPTDSLYTSRGEQILD